MKTTNFLVALRLLLRGGGRLGQFERAEAASQRQRRGRRTRGNPMRGAHPGEPSTKHCHALPGIFTKNLLSRRHHKRGFEPRRPHIVFADVINLKL